MARPLPLAAFALGLLLAAGAGADRRLALAYRSLELPGAPSVVVPTDLDGDGRRDLAVVVAFTEWDQVGIEEVRRMDDVEGLVEVLTIVPALIDRRELWLFRAVEGEGYRPAGPPLLLGPEVLAVEAGPPGLPLVALTDDGLAAVRWRDGEAGGGSLSLEPLFRRRPVLAGSGTFVPRLGMVVDLDGDGRSDVLFPGREGALSYLARDEDPGAPALAPSPADHVAYPRDDHLRAEGFVRNYPLPELRDVDGDRLPDLLIQHPRRGWNLPRIARGEGGGRFGPLIAPLGEAAERDAAGPPVVYAGDLDGDGRLEYVSQEELRPEGGGMRRELHHARRPPQVYRFYRSRADLRPEAEPYHELRAEGYAFAGDDEHPMPGGFQDLDGDGRQDLVTLTLDFSILQAVRIVATRSLSVGLDFHVFCQGDDGRFRPVEGLDLSGRFHLDLDHLRLGRLAQFAGDFDGDGRADFVQMGRGERMTIHRGGDGCRYPAAADLVIELEQEPRDLALVEVTDLDGDGRADLMVIQPEERRRSADAAATAPVRLDLYLSGGGP